MGGAFFKEPGKECYRSGMDATICTNTNATDSFTRKSRDHFEGFLPRSLFTSLYPLQYGISQRRYTGRRRGTMDRNYQCRKSGNPDVAPDRCDCRKILVTP